MSALWLLKKRPLEQRPQALNWAADPWAFSVHRNHELVVRAPNEFEARRAAEEVAGSESTYEQVWMNPAMTSCEMISWSGPTQVISGVTKDWKHKNTQRKKKVKTDYIPDQKSTKIF